MEQLDSLRKDALNECRKLAKYEKANLTVIKKYLLKYDQRNIDDIFGEELPYDKQVETALLMVGYYTLMSRDLLPEIEDPSCGICLVFPEIHWGLHNIYEEINGRDWAYTLTQNSFTITNYYAPDTPISIMVKDYIDGRYPDTFWAHHYEMRKEIIIEIINAYESAIKTS